MQYVWVGLKRDQFANCKGISLLRVPWERNLKHFEGSEFKRGLSDDMFDSAVWLFWINNLVEQRNSYAWKFIDLPRNLSHWCKFCIHWQVLKSWFEGGISGMVTAWQGESKQFFLIKISVVFKIKKFYRISPKEYLSEFSLEPLLKAQSQKNTASHILDVKHLTHMCYMTQNSMGCKCLTKVF